MKKLIYKINYYKDTELSKEDIIILKQLVTKLPEFRDKKTKQYSCNFGINFVDEEMWFVINNPIFNSNFKEVQEKLFRYIFGNRKFIHCDKPSRSNFFRVSNKKINRITKHLSERCMYESGFYMYESGFYGWEVKNPEDLPDYLIKLKDIFKDFNYEKD